MQDLNNIWNAEDELNEEQLLNYIQNKSTPEDAHNFEKKMNESEFLNDGTEGLQQFSSAEKINAYVQQINEDLHHKLAEKKARKKLGVKNLSWELLTLIVVIVLCLIGFAVIQMMRH